MLFDCPWKGHLLDPNFVIVNSKQPQIQQRACVKCDCLVLLIAASPVVGPEGEALPAVTPPEPPAPAEGN